MASESSPQYARVEQPFGCPPPIVHCPICGNASIEEGRGATPCPHLAFIYVEAGDAFEYTSDVFRERLSQFDLESVDLETFEQMLAEAGYGNNLLALEITYGGMACGPAWSTVVFGFDYSTLREPA